MPVSICEWRIRIGRFLPRAQSDGNTGYTPINHSRTKGKKQKQSHSNVSQENDQKHGSHESRSLDYVVVLILVTLLTLVCLLRISEGLVPNIDGIGESFDARSGRTSILNSPVWSIQSISTSYDNLSFEHSEVEKSSRLNSCCFPIQSVPPFYDTSLMTPPSNQTTSDVYSRVNPNGIASCSNSSGFGFKEPSTFGLAMQVNIHFVHILFQYFRIF